MPARRRTRPRRWPLAALALATLGIPACAANSAPADGGAPDLARRCDPRTQDCADPLQKCTITGYEENTGAPITTCLKPTGMRGEGADCTRKSDDLSGIGRDDCAPGLFCSALGALAASGPQHHRCRRYCGSDDTCPGNTRCINISEPHLYGVCIPTCEPFAPCPDNLDCANALPDIDGLSAALVCRVPGPKTTGMECQSDLDCASNLLCNILINPRRCIPLCDTNHPCTEGTCSEIPGGTQVCL